METKTKLPEDLTASQVLEMVRYIPPKKWCTGDFERNGKCCLAGHISRKLTGNPDPYDTVINNSHPMVKLIYDQFVPKIEKVLKVSPISVNNGCNYGIYAKYTGGIKQRVVAMLKDAIAAGV